MEGWRGVPGAPLPARPRLRFAGPAILTPITRSFGELLWRPTGLPTNVPNLTSMNSNIEVTLHMPFESTLSTNSDFILQMGSHFCEMSPQKDNHGIPDISKDGKHSKYPTINPVKYMEREFCLGCIWNSLVVKKWTDSSVGANRKRPSRSIVI